MRKMFSNRAKAETHWEPRGCLATQREMQKVTAAAGAISQTIQSTLSTVQSLQDQNRSRYVNYDIVARHLVEYLIDLQSFFNPTKHLITRESLRKILATERYTESLLVTYTKELIKEMNQIRSLRSKLSAQGHTPQG